MAFAILEKSNGLQHWIKILSPSCINTTAVHGAARKEFQYPDRDAAERDAEALRALNAREVEDFNRRRKYNKWEPATYTVIQLQTHGDI